MRASLFRLCRLLQTFAERTGLPTTAGLLRHEQNCEENGGYDVLHAPAEIWYENSADLLRCFMSFYVFYRLSAPLWHKTS